MAMTSPASAGDVDRVGNLRHRLRAAADPAAITDDAVRVYCAALGRSDHRMEAALLRQAPAVIDLDRLIDSVICGEHEPPSPVGLDRIWPNRRWARVRRLYWARLHEYLVWRAR